MTLNPFAQFDPRSMHHRVSPVPTGQQQHLHQPSAAAAAAAAQAHADERPAFLRERAVEAEARRRHDEAERRLQQQQHRLGMGASSSPRFEGLAPGLRQQMQQRSLLMRFGQQRLLHSQDSVDSARSPTLDSLPGLMLPAVDEFAALQLLDDEDTRAEPEPAARPSARFQPYASSDSSGGGGGGGGGSAGRSGEDWRGRRDRSRSGRGGSAGWSGARSAFGIAAAAAAHSAMLQHEDVLSDQNRLLAELHRERELRRQRQHEHSDAQHSSSRPMDW